MNNNNDNATERKRILIVDDDEALNRTLKLSLEDTDKFVVYSELKGANALTAVKEFNPDLIILDMMMPDMDGAEVESVLSKAEISKNIPIIFLTATAREDDPLGKGFIKKGHYIIAKPLTAEEIVTCVQNYLKANPKLNRKMDLGW